MEIRRLRESDYIEFLKLINSFKEANLTRFEFEQILDEKRDAGSFVYVMVDDDNIIGTITLNTDHKFINNGGLAGYSEDLVVHPQCRGKGIGYQLLHHLLTEAKRIGCYKVVAVANKNSKTIHDRIGFHEFNETALRHDLNTIPGIE